jgi:hypothetical protein
MNEVGRNLCCKKPGPFGNLPVRKTGAEWATSKLGLSGNEATVVTSILGYFI